MTEVKEAFELLESLFAELDLRRLLWRVWPSLSLMFTAANPASYSAPSRAGCLTVEERVVGH